MDVNDVMHRKCTRRILGDLKKSVSWELDSEQEGSTFGARWGQTNSCATSAARDRRQMENQNRKNVYLSPYVEEPLNSKVIKSFVSGLRSRYVFFVFQDSYVLCIYFMNSLCMFHISVSWVCYSKLIVGTQIFRYILYIGRFLTEHEFYYKQYMV